MGSGFSQPTASSPIGSVNSASIPVRWTTQHDRRAGHGMAPRGAYRHQENEDGEESSHRCLRR